MAPWTARLRSDHTVSSHSSLRTVSQRGPAHASHALAGFCAIPYGTHPSEDDHSRSAYRSSVRMDQFLQPRRHEESPRIDCGCAGALQDQSPGGATVLSRHLLSSKGSVSVVEGVLGKPEYDLPHHPGILHELARISRRG